MSYTGMYECVKCSVACELTVTAIVRVSMQDTVSTLIFEWKIILEYELNTCQVMYGMLQV